MSYQPKVDEECIYFNRTESKLRVKFKKVVDTFWFQCLNPSTGNLLLLPATTVFPISMESELENWEMEYQRITKLANAHEGKFYQLLNARK